MVEQEAVNFEVTGSSPVAGAKNRVAKYYSVKKPSVYAIIVRLLFHVIQVQLHGDN